MLTSTTKPYPYRGDLYGYILLTSSDGTVTTKDYDTVPTQIFMSLSVNLLGQLLIESPSKMQLNAYLKNIIDKNGEEVYTDGVWEIIQTAPILGPLGIKGGYQYRANLIDGQI